MTTTPTLRSRLLLAAAALLLAAGAAVLALPALAPHEALAQDEEAPPFTYEASVSILEGQPVQVRFTPTASLASLEVEIDRKKGDTLHFERTNLRAGEQVVFEWEQKAGTVAYKMSVRAVDLGGDRFEGSTTFEVSAMSALSIEIDYKNLDLEAGKLGFIGSRAPARAELAVFGEGKVLIDQVEQSFDGKKRDVIMHWTSNGTQPVLMELKVFDASEAWSSTQIFRLEVPHEDVVFDSNESVVRDDQTHKLETTLAAIQDALATYDTVAMELYVAGYTDTVGKAEKNVDLSEKRAKSIAAWFRKKGLSIPVYYQGFGEEVLHAQTGDEVDNEQNRRAVYLLTNGAPGTSGAFPRANWKRIK